MINQCTIVGRLVADPESRQTPNGKSVCSIRVAVDRKGREKETDFFSCTAFGQQGDALAEYAQKGRLIGIVGKKQQSVKIMIDNWQLLDSRKDSEASPPNPKPAGVLKVDDIDDPFAD